MSDKTVTDAEKAEILRLHNEKRSLVATGGEERGRPGPQHRAANMMELVIYVHTRTFSFALIRITRTS